MNINMGPETVEDLYEAGYIKDTADLYTLEIADLLRWNVGLTRAPVTCGEP